MPAGLPANWLGINFEVFDLPTSGTGTISFAVRWHGDRPAMLWEQSPGTDGPVPLTFARSRTGLAIGRALWRGVVGPVQFLMTAE